MYKLCIPPLWWPCIRYKVKQHPTEQLQLQQRRERPERRKQQPANTLQPEYGRWGGGCPAAQKPGMLRKTFEFAAANGIAPEFAPG
mmetsp:Transcript_5233/g.11647  ORF Transcript_5233/g.11647 Transcript_5233/m.11647 type:complete len:86 (+) Transcript_5233:72-329(+)